MNRKVWGAGLVACFVSLVGNAGTLNIQCANGQFTLTVAAEENENCSLEQELTVEGEESSDVVNVASGQEQVEALPLQPTDQANLVAALECTTDEGSTNQSQSSSDTNNGCSQTAAELPDTATATSDDLESVLSEALDAPTDLETSIDEALELNPDQIDTSGPNDSVAESDVEAVANEGEEVVVEDVSVVVNGEEIEDPAEIAEIQQRIDELIANLRAQFGF